MKSKEIIGRLLLAGGVLGAGIQSAQAINKAQINREILATGSTLAEKLREEADIKSACNSDVCVIEQIPGRDSKDQQRILEEISAYVDKQVPQYNEFREDISQDVALATLALAGAGAGLIILEKSKQEAES